MIKAKVRGIVRNYMKGRLRCSEFAITNACIAKCSFCDIWKQRPKVFADKARVLTAIDRLAAFGVSHLTLTGGEPLLHPDIMAFVERATRNSMNNALLVAAPSLLMRGDTAERLAAAGCDLVSISFDSDDPATMAKSRRIPGIMDDMARAVELSRGVGLKTMASVLIWNDNFDRLDTVCARAVDMGFDVISLNYPTFSQSKVYTLGGEGVSLSRESVIAALRDAISLKRSGKYPILNSAISMQNIINYLNDPATVKYPCFGGARVLFVDWFFDVHPCMQLPTVLGNILTMDEGDLRIPSCNSCNMSWYRDFSTFFNGTRAIPVLLESMAYSSTYKNL